VKYSYQYAFITEIIDELDTTKNEMAKEGQDAE